MGLFGEMGKSEEKLEFPKEEKNKKIELSKKQRKGKVSSILQYRIIVDVDGLGESVPYDEKIHSELKIGDIIIL